MAQIQGTNNLRSSTALPGSTNYSAMAMVTTLFFTWGFCTVLNDADIPHLQSIFELSYLQASLIQLAFFSSYFLFALPAGKLVEKVGYKSTMVIGLGLMCLGALLFVPAASAATNARETRSSAKPGSVATTMNSCVTFAASSLDLYWSDRYSSV